mmetsp:Transcript_30168/g.95113  ORF Transcript_30168/g.95113 Transcript_30168/m.95113 type:complete len:288 (+) Transcript_30168:706-1569(+)
MCNLVAVSLAVALHAVELLLRCGEHLLPRRGAVLQLTVLRLVLLHAAPRLAKGIIMSVTIPLQRLMLLLQRVEGEVALANLLLHARPLLLSLFHGHGELKLHEAPGLLALPLVGRLYVQGPLPPDVRLEICSPEGALQVFQGMLPLSLLLCVCRALRHAVARSQAAGREAGPLRAVAHGGHGKGLHATAAPGLRGLTLPGFVEARLNSGGVLRRGIPLPLVELRNLCVQLLHAAHEPGAVDDEPRALLCLAESDGREGPRIPGRRHHRREPARVRPCATAWAEQGRG